MSRVKTAVALHTGKGTVWLSAGQEIPTGLAKLVPGVLVEGEVQQESLQESVKVEGSGEDAPKRGRPRTRK